MVYCVPFKASVELCVSIGFLWKKHLFLQIRLVSVLEFLSFFCTTERVTILMFVFLGGMSIDVSLFANGGS